MPSEAAKHYQTLAGRNHSIDLTRGRPSPEFLDLAEGLAGSMPPDMTLDGKDIRNYCGFPGLPSTLKLGAGLLQAPVDHVLVGGNSSLTLLSWVLNMAWFQGINGQPAWSTLPEVACLCPVPGYDRHFILFDTFGIAMPTVAMTGEGADMDALEQALRDNPEIRALMFVPRHSNPTGDIWSEATLTRLMQLAAQMPEDFVLLCDNAYAIHDFLPSPPLLDIFALAEQHGALNRLFLLASTSKLGYAGSGLGFVACSQANRKQLMGLLQGISLGADPLSQARHALFFKDGDGLHRHFAKVAPLIRARFEVALKALQPLEQMPGVRISKPTGGYFLSVHLPPGTARRTVELAGQAGVVLTGAGSAFPGNHDPDDSHLRLAPTSPEASQLPAAMEVICASAALAAEEAGVG